MFQMDVRSIIAAASNVRSGDNPDYKAEQFLELYPQFSGLPGAVIAAWLKMAHNCVQFSRWGDLWEMGMGLYMAHFLTLHMQASVPDNSNGSQIVSAGLTKGLTASKSVADMSVSYDTGAVANEFKGWGTLQQTVYGQQLASFARVVGKGGMCIW